MFDICQTYVQTYVKHMLNICWTYVGQLLNIRYVNHIFEHTHCVITVSNSTVPWYLAASTWLHPSHQPTPAMSSVIRVVNLKRGRNDTDPNDDRMMTDSSSDAGSSRGKIVLPTPEWLQAHGLPAAYVVKACFLCGMISTSPSVFPETHDDVRAWFPLIAWQCGNKDQPRGDVCRHCEHNIVLM